MATATMSLMGLYNYNPHMFDNMALPEGVDRDTLVFNLVVECAELEVLIPDPVWMAKTVEKWSQKEVPVWEKLLATTKLEYDPISNYDRKEEWTESNSASSRNSETSEKSGNSSITGNDTSNGTSTGKVAAFNADSFVDANGAETSVENSKTENGTTSENKTLTQESSAENQNTRTGHTYGNIGVTTSQQMIEEERRVVQFNIYDYIIQSFQRRFCLLVY